MECTHSLEQSAEYANHALSLMQAHKIPPHPNNFAVWYAYISGQSAQICQVIDTLLARSEAITEAHVASLYEEFCSGNRETTALYSIMELLERELTAAVAALERAGVGSRQYSEILEATATEVSGVAPGMDGPLQRTVNRLLMKTRAMGVQTREVERQLLVSWSQVGKLSIELEETRREAHTDPLTGLGNRKMFDRALRTAAIDAIEAGEPLTLALLDVDHFKSFNDEFGHILGDQVLRLIGVILRDNIKGQDIAARYGGEEFAIILPKTTAKDGCVLANTIRKAIGGKRLVNRQNGEKLRQITVSIGIAQHLPTEPLPNLISAADRALYYAKELGRDRVINHDDVHESTTDERPARPVATVVRSGERS